MVRRQFSTPNKEGTHKADSLVNMTIEEIQRVGSIARAPRSEGEKPLGKAMIATIHDDETTASVLWESCIPQPLSGSFLVTPAIGMKPSQDDDETTMELSRIQSLLDFESEEQSPVMEDQIQAIALWKDRGDQLLRTGDPTTAIPYYEMALARSSVISIGASVICSVQGYPKVAEIDYLEDDTVDIMFVDSGEDTTISRSDILICILENTNMWQERILLNLARCLLQQADIDRANRAKYLKAAILACTLVLSICSFHDADGSQFSDMAQTALQLRAKAYISLSKWPHATADAKRLKELGHVQGRKLLDSIERERTQQAKRDKKLVKAISRLVATATSESVSEKNDDTEFEETSQPENGASPVTTSKPALLILSSPLLIIVSLIAAFFLQKAIK